MRSRLSTIASRCMMVALSLLMITGARCGGPPQQALMGDESGGRVLDSESTDLANLVNVERRLRGQPSLTWNQPMADVAKQYSRELASDDHWSYNFAIHGQDADTRMRIAGLVFTESGHAGGVDFRAAETMLNALIANNSFVLTQSKYSRIGVGVTSNGSRNFWTILVTN